MIYNQDDDQDFLSDKRVQEVSDSNVPHRRGGAYVNDTQKEAPKKSRYKDENEEENESNMFNTIVSAIAVVIIIIAVIVMIIIFKRDSSSPTNKEENVGSNVENNVNKEPNNSNTSTNTNTNSNSNSNSNTNNQKDKENTNKSSLAISNLNENYDAYPIDIESVVYKKGGNFYNNNDGIKGDKVYVEYKQIKGLKDTQKQDKINEMLENLSVELYDKNYLADKDTLFVDIHTKLSVNFNTLSYVVIRTGQDIDGNEFGEQVKTLNIRLDNLEKIEFEDLFLDNTNIKSIYTDYVKGKVENFYFDPQNIYVYNGIKETKIDMKNKYSDIAIYKRYSTSSSLFAKNASSQKVFTTLKTTVSEETKDRAFEKNK